VDLSRPSLVCMEISFEYKSIRFAVMRDIHKLTKYVALAMTLPSVNTLDSFEKTTKA
jgi:hypothetical protein